MFRCVGGMNALAACLLLPGAGGTEATPYVYSELTSTGGMNLFGINGSGIGQSLATRS